MRIIYFGSSSFSVIPLKSIASSVCCVVTKKGKPRGRGYVLEDNEVKLAALELDLPLMEIESFKDEAFRAVTEFQPELFVVASFGLIIPKWVLDLPVLGPVNVHPSLLPRYRGPSPIQGVILQGEKETGITLIRMNEKMDAGNILYQERFPMGDDDNAAGLSEGLSKRVGELLPEFLKNVAENGLGEGIVQNHEAATFTPIITKEMGRIDWGKKATDIARQIRAFVMWPTGHTFLESLILKIYAAEVADAGDTRSNLPGTVLDVRREGFLISSGEGTLLAREVQLQSKKRMSAFDFARGYRGLPGKLLV
jgi:methionyl-tRNA formyltransferase